MRLLRTTQSKYYRASAVHSLGSIWTNRKDLESELGSCAFLQSVDPVVNNLIEDANSDHSNVFNIDGERTTSVLEASSWVGEWGANLLAVVNDLIDEQESFNEAYLEISKHAPEGGFDNLEQTIDHLQLSIGREERIVLDTLGEWATAANVPSQQADDGERNGVLSVDVEVPKDGVYRESKLVIWGGRRFECLTRGQIEVIDLLHDRYKKGLPDVNLKDIKRIAKVQTNNGFKQNVFKLNRKSGPRIHPVACIVFQSTYDSYRLIDPRKVPKSS
ncbi:MAG: hypothetical protein ACOYKN_12480 [Pirellula sp.]